MKLDKKSLAARAMGVGVGRILFNTERLAEIKEAITKQDIRDLVKDGAIFVREPQGRRFKKQRKQRRREGSFRKNVSTKKKDYMLFVRSARRIIAHALLLGTISPEQSAILRKEIKARRIAMKSALRDRIKEMQTP